jgi:hypothetical protein
MVEGYGGATILSHPLFVEAVLPFLLVFALVFAVLQKTKVLGEGKKQIDAIVSLVIGLLFIAFGQAVGIVVNLIPVLAVGLVVILIFLLLWGSFFPAGMGDNKGVKIAAGIVALLVAIGALLWVTGWWSLLLGLFVAGTGTGIFVNVLFIVLIIGAVLWAIFGTKDKSSE